MPAARLTLIAAVARNGVIGIDNRLPWRLPADLRRFKALTLGHTVIMGRKTWESLPEPFRPLPGRRNVVVTRDRGYCAAGATVAASLDAALRVAHGDEAFVIGGAELYAAALPLADRLEMTEIDASFAGDSFFPVIKWGQWRETTRETAHDEAGFDYAFVSYRRIGT